MVTSTPEGTATGSFPMRDMPVPLPLPDVGEDFAAHAVPLGLTVGLETRGRRDDRDAEATENVRQFGRFCVDPQAGLGHAPEAGDAALTVGAVLELDDQVLVLLARLVAVARDVALTLEDLGDVRLDLRVGKHDLVVVRRVRVTQTGQEVCDGVGHRHGDLSTFLAWFPINRTGPVAKWELETLTSWTCGRRAARPRVPSREGRSGRARTCGTRRAGGR